MPTDVVRIYRGGSEHATHLVDVYEGEEYLDYFQKNHPNI